MCPRPVCAAPPGRGGPRPAGPQPPPGPNPFPLVPGSRYLPPPGQGIVIHGPGDPAAPFKPHPGRPDPATFHLPGQNNLIRPVPGAQRRPQPRPAPRAPRPRQPFQPRQPAAPRPFQPAPAPQPQPFNPRGPARQPFNPRAPTQPQGRFFDPRSGGQRQPFGAQRPFNDAPAVDLEVNQKSVSELIRKRRSVQEMENAAGTVDVRTAISAMDLEENVKLTPCSQVIFFACVLVVTILSFSYRNARCRNYVKHDV